MSYFSTLMTIGGIYILVLASPGPNFLLISQLSLAGHRKSGIKLALGVALGSIIWVVLAIEGLISFLSHISWFYISIRWIGIIYLVWIGVGLIWRVIHPITTRQPKLSVLPKSNTAFRVGLLTSLTNPKAGVFWTSIFVTLFPTHAPTWVFISTALMIFILSASWYIGIAFALSSKQMQTSYSKLQRPIDIIYGIILISLGIRLATSY